ncbi:hypothetical protein ONE63_008531 [Megalurothrips usitatus]|uniref:Uncharacterized protein n=1 Tax=Megalurothrips usitatus TaxID=439358 RepID=A0AAV7XMQ2_9NEOP|nr:hypothetical protein ONE63_008531 [Megalurothrips usitatus]
MSSRSSNGSVITLTMHNNHLIVEKEEIVGPRAASSSRQRPAPCATAQPRPLLPPPPPPGPAAFDQKAIVHQPPARGPGGPALVRQRAETGLSQPDLSSASEGETPPYAYGNQVGYDAGPMGYAEYNGYRPDDPPDQPRQLARTALPTRMTTAAAAAAASSGPRHHHHHHLPVQDSMDVQDLPDDSQQPQRLLSDIQAHEHALQHQASAAVNGDVKLDLDTSTAVAVDDGEEDSTTEDACSVKAQSPPKLQTLGIGAAPPALDQPLRSPVVDKLRLQDASPLTERFPAPAAPKTPPPPRSPLAAADDRGRAEPGEAGAAGAAGAGGAAS